MDRIIFQIQSECTSTPVSQFPQAHGQRPRVLHVHHHQPTTLTIIIKANIDLLVTNTAITRFRINIKDLERLTSTIISTIGTNITTPILDITIIDTVTETINKRTGMQKGTSPFRLIGTDTEQPASVKDHVPRALP